MSGEWSNYPNEYTITGQYLTDAVRLRPVPDGLELTVEVGSGPDDESTVVLPPSTVRRLRLALQRFERNATD